MSASREQSPQFYGSDQRSPDARGAPAGAEDDRISRLEAQLQEMQTVLEMERQKHKEERQALASKLRVLESQSKTADGTTSGPTSPRGPTINRGERTIASTPRTADNLFVAIPSRHDTNADPSVANAQRIAAQRAARRARTGVTSSAASGSVATRSTRGPVGGASDASSRNVARTGPLRTPDKTGGAAGSSQLSATQRRATALQHAWDRFCALARTEFTPKELSLVSAETLHSLMDHYKIRSSIERAQIEGQWALLQEGKSTVGETATPKPVPNARRRPVKRADHPAPFDLGGDLGKPHLSARQPLGNEGVKPSNPNESTSGSKLVRSHSATVLLRPRDPGPSNPNETQSRSSTPRLCFRRCESPGPGKETPRGMRHVNPKESGEFTPRGIKSHGSTHMGGDAAKPNSVKCGIEPSARGDGPRRGVRTFDSIQSPTQARKPSIHVATPPHLNRVHLLTETLGRGGDWQNRTPRRVDPVERRTPFALGDN